mgnify:CR=1 FL=1|jgi:hypothetical protein
MKPETLARIKVPLALPVLTLTRLYSRLSTGRASGTQPHN